MKKLLLMVAIIVTTYAANAQVNDTIKTIRDTSVFTAIDQFPEFPGGIEQFAQYLKKNLRYPKQAIDDKTQGTVRASFIVNKDGSITDIKITKGLSDDTDAEAIRLISKMPKWNPGMQNGKPVRVNYSVPIKFEL